MLTYTITDIDGVTFDQDVIVTVGDRAEVKELTDEGVWEAVTGITVTPSTGNTAKDIMLSRSWPVFYACKKQCIKGNFRIVQGKYR